MIDILPPRYFKIEFYRSFTRCPLVGHDFDLEVAIEGINRTDWFKNRLCVAARLRPKLFALNSSDGKFALK